MIHFIEFNSILFVMDSHPYYLTNEDKCKFYSIIALKLIK